MRVVKAQHEERTTYLNLQHVVSFDVVPASEADEGALRIRFFVVDGRAYLSLDRFADADEAVAWLTGDPVAPDRFLRSAS